VQRAADKTIALLQLVSESDFVICLQTQQCSAIFAFYGMQVPELSFSLDFLKTSSRLEGEVKLLKNFNSLNKFKFLHLFL